MNRTFWDGPDDLRAPKLERALRVDVAVIGGGFAGLSTARHLKAADPGLEIALLEREYIGYGASGRNAGILSPFIPVTWLVDCQASRERLEDIRFAAHYITREMQSLEQLIRQERINCDFRPTRVITTAANRRRGRLLRLLGERLLLAGVPANIPTPAELKAAVPFPAHDGYVLDGFSLQPMALVQGLAHHARRLGVHIYEHTAVTGLRSSADGVEVTIGTGSCLSAAKAVVATNAYTRELIAAPKKEIPAPVYTFLLATPPLDHPAIEDRTIVEIGREYFYARMHKGRLLFGGFDQPCKNPEMTAVRRQAYLRRLEYEWKRRFPSCAGVAPAAFWGGPYHESRTQVPIIRHLKEVPGVILNIGYGGVGVTLTQFSGKLVAGLVLAGSHHDPDAERMRAIYDSTRMPIREGLKFGLQWASSLSRRLPR